MTALPQLSPKDTLSDRTKAYVDALSRTPFKGEVEISYASRMAVATDNSIYQRIPQAVLFPTSLEDLALIAKTGNEFEDVTFSARGGGTGTNGQSLTPGIVIDTSRHMREIIELNLEQEWVKVQCGVIKDALNDYLRPHGYFFSPDLSTSNRATIGGMINTDASGQGSLVYGKTSDHVLELTSVSASGEIIHSKPISVDEATKLSTTDTDYGRILKQVLDTCISKRQAILDKFPRLNRFLTGYDLEHAYDEQHDNIDVSRLLAGSEGSLAFIADAKLNITKIPKHTALVNVKYNDFESALRHAPSMIAANATSVETVDSRVLNLARGDIVWHSVSNLIQDVPDKVMDGLNMVEYNNDDEAAIKEKIATLSKRLDEEIASASSGVIGYQITYDTAEIKKIYAMRKKAVGLLGKTKGSKKPIAFAEDTAVPPEKLADFIMEFRALLDSHKLEYGMFGHVDAGVLHVRPALDLYDEAQEKLVKTISDQVVKLVAKYGGLMWGEHGKGYRSEYAPAFFGEQLYDEICKIKAAFDPLNKMNPGKICTPYASSASLVKVDDVKRASFDRQIPVQFRDEFAPAMSCNGNGLCFNYDTTSPMCPSSKITKDRRHSPKGRAGLIREWLLQLHQHGVTTDSLSYKSFSDSPVKKWFAGANKQDDFSHEVFEAMNGCLACKSCTNQCPVNVDVPDFRSKFLAIYYTRYRRPLKDYFVANVERLAPLLAKIPRLSNAVLDTKLTKYVLSKWIGYVDAPQLSYPPLSARVSALQSEYDYTRLTQLPEAQKAKHVLIVQDPFTSFYDADSVDATLKFIRALGLIPVLLPFSPNGKPQHVKGFLAAFEKTAQTTATFLSKVSQLDMPMVGIDASLVLCYRDEYQKILGSSRGDFNVSTLTEWLNDISVPTKLSHITEADEPYYLFAHCSEKTALPTSEKDWQQAFHKFGLSLEVIPVGCCGMAGTYGHETEHLENSIGIYDLSWRQNVAQLQQERVLATGYSCRSQVKRLADFRPQHPIEVLASRLVQGVG
ncbi:FAD-binding and (Fe-S)-binding domain-containing protein [Glaciecola sp. XM2]|uniref:D-2-hydroxyglutarate dehydrogenase YdiJ n=1 Tax=Glaciecola sp. XM2 TaxID=1914931 RepID=UPI0020330E74|nr:FAD-binding and (Fe-S)-binding domain-containing protein [Glaciecola sp. XM2]